ncbi:hypothetical protein [Micromonospora radicis]|uniref:DUF916 domain-containing protein n=1 Tax=Micromonospora radicis TaxID=1894971 RepID=A0A418N0V7_9ACTN|nr:hypothetical protein [Micromonospora radicis]RIV41176.1 hypothetical protein D2L64_00095 [Micromonospora radicis]
MIRPAPGVPAAPRLLPRLLAALAALVVVGSVTPAGAAAQPAGPTVTWAVQPANQQGPDGRRWVELTLDPGQVVTEHLAVRNFGAAPVVFSLKAADGYLTDKGRFNMLSSDRVSVDGGTWIEVQEKVTVGARETRVVPFTIRVPVDASPGDHPAGIAASVVSASGAVAVESRVGFRVMLRASGTVTAALSAEGLAATYRRSWNPFTAGTLRVTYTASNTGNVAVTGTGRVRTEELFGLVTRDGPGEVAETLPGGERQVEAAVGGVWGLGRVTTGVEVTPAVVGGDPAVVGGDPAVVGGDPAGAQLRPAVATVTVWVLPWPQLALVVVLAALVLLWRGVTRRRRRRLARLLAEARDEGRAEARTTALTGG